VRASLAAGEEVSKMTETELARQEAEESLLAELRAALEELRPLVEELKASVDRLEGGEGMLAAVALIYDRKGTETAAGILAR